MQCVLLRSIQYEREVLMRFADFHYGGPVHLQIVSSISMAVVLVATSAAACVHAY